MRSCILSRAEPGAEQTKGTDQQTRAKPPSRAAEGCRAPPSPRGAGTPPEQPRPRKPTPRRPCGCNRRCGAATYSTHRGRIEWEEPSCATPLPASPASAWRPRSRARRVWPRHHPHFWALSPRPGQSGIAGLVTHTTARALFRSRRATYSLFVCGPD